MNAENKVKVMAVLLLVAACGLMIPVAGEDETTVDSEAAPYSGIAEADQPDKTVDSILKVVISLAAILLTIAGMLYIVRRMKNQTRRV